MHDKNRDRTVSRFRRIATGFADYRRRHRDYARLQEMPDSLLEDIGLTRGQINAAKWRPFV